MKINYSGSFDLPFLLMGLYIGENISDLSKEIEVKSVKKTEFIRLSKVGKDILNIKEGD